MVTVEIFPVFYSAPLWVSDGFHRCEQFDGASIYSRALALARACDVQDVHLVEIEPMDDRFHHLVRNPGIDLDDETRRFCVFSKNASGQRTAIQFPKIDDQSCVAVFDVAAGTLAISTRCQLLELILGRNDPVFSKASAGSPPTMGVTMLDSEIQRRPVRSSLSARDDVRTQTTRIGDRTV